MNKAEVNKLHEILKWYKEKFGYNINPYTSLENAIDTWPNLSIIPW